MRFLAVLRSPAIIVSRLAVLRNCSRSTLDRLTTTYVMRHFTRLSAGGLALLHQSEPLPYAAWAVYRARAVFSAIVFLSVLRMV